MSPGPRGQRGGRVLLGWGEGRAEGTKSQGRTGTPHQTGDSAACARGAPWSPQDRAPPWSHLALGSPVSVRPSRLAEGCTVAYPERKPGRHAGVRSRWFEGSWDSGLGARCGRAKEPQGPRLSCAARPPGNWGATAAAFRQPNHNPSLCPGLDASPPASTHELTIPNDVSMPSPPAPRAASPRVWPSEPQLPNGKGAAGDSGLGVGGSGARAGGMPGAPAEPG